MSLESNWRNSSVYKRWKIKMAQQPKPFSEEFTTLFIRKIMDTQLTREELLNEINVILHYSKTDLDFDHYIYTNFSLTSKDKLYSDFIRTLYTWYAYLDMYLKVEDYELCAKIRDVINVEKKFFFDCLMEFNSEYDISDAEMINFTDSQVKNQFKL